MLLAFDAVGENGVSWSYSGDRGPDRWGHLSAQYKLCSEGRRQSPIEIRNTRARRLPALALHYKSSPLQVEHANSLVRIGYQAGSYMRVGSRRFELKEFHFHSPGEHLVDGRPGELEIHLVHRDKNGRYGIIAIPVVAGRRFNVMLQRLREYLPINPGERRYYRRVGIKPVFLMPTDRSYYTYEGSLTTPPCSEQVTWFIMRNPLEVSIRQIADFQELLGATARPVQALNERPIWFDPR